MLTAQPVSYADRCLDVSSLAAWPLSNARYRIEGCLGSGCFGTVFQATRYAALEPPLTVALKVMKRHSIETESRELEVMLLLREAPGCVHLNEYFYMEPCAGMSTLVLALDICGRNLCTHIAQTHGAPRLQQVRAAGADLARALTHIHGLGIIHRDIKSDNVLVKHRNAGPASSRDSYLIADFGHAKLQACGPCGDGGTSHQEMERSCAYVFAADYRAPELFFGCSLYATKPDVWALGCTLAELLLSGTPCFAPRCALPLPTDDEQDDPEPLDGSFDDGLSLAQRQLLSLFECFGTPSWQLLLQMNPALAANEDRVRAWMRMPPREPSRPWRERLLKALGDEHAPFDESADAIEFFTAVFQWDPHVRARAEDLDTFDLFRKVNKSTGSA